MIFHLSGSPNILSFATPLLENVINQTNVCENKLELLLIAPGFFLEIRFLNVNLKWNFVLSG